MKVNLLAAPRRDRGRNWYQRSLRSKGPLDLAQGAAKQALGGWEETDLSKVAA